jgi:hypothetical protein
MRNSSRIRGSEISTDKSSTLTLHCYMAANEIDSESWSHAFPHGALDFKTVYDEELCLIKHSGGNPEQTAAICLSGGGIRSAIFSLGCLQALDAKGLLRNFDYLSTVSGGGYIGSWLSAFIASNTPAPNGSLLNGLEGTQALEFLRDNSSYLTPRNGIFSGDTWSLIAIYVRNLLLNWLMILPLFAAVLILPRILIPLGEILGPDTLYTAAIAFGVLALIYPTIVPALPDVPEVPSRPTQAASQPDSVRRFWMEPKQFIWARLVPFALAILSLGLWYFTQYQASPLTAKISLDLTEHLAVWVFAPPAVIFFLVGVLVSLCREGTKQVPTNSFVAILVFGTQSLASLSAVAVTLVFSSGNIVSFFLWFPFAATMVFLGAHILFAGLTDPIVEDENREWWARSAGYFVMMTIGWSLFSLVAIVLPDYLDHNPQLLESFFQEPAKVGAVGAAGVLSGAIAFYTRIENQAAAVTKGLAAFGETSRKWIFSIALAVFVLIVACLLSYLTTLLTTWINETYALRSYFKANVIAAVGLFAFSYALSIPININRFSTHAAYRNRLVRTFLGASNGSRFYNPFTGFSSKDNVYLHALVRPPLKRDKEDAVKNIERKATYQRPFHLICATANLASGERLAWQDRKAVSFTFSGLHCGSFQLGYRKSEAYGGSCGVTLGTAMTISAAAVNSGMGFYSSPLKSFLLTLLNARLGWWLGNPNHTGSWKRDSPALAFGPMIDELFSLTDAKAKFVNLSDGGHFDNTGVYEMIRRRCKYILLVDADTTLSGMTNMALRVRVDLKTTLELQPPTATGLPFEEYKIQYPELDGKKPFTGVLIRVFPQIAAGSQWCTFESLEYQRIHQDFPGTSLIDQFFTEGPFEAYRKLGQDIMHARIVFQSSQGGTGLDLVF